MNETVDASGEKPGASTVSVHKEVFSYEGSVATSVMEAATFSLSAVDHGLDDSAILCLNGNDDPIRSGQRIDCEHTKGGLAVDEDMGVLSLQRIQILPQDSLTTHSIYQGYFHTGKLNVGGHQVYSLQVVQDTLAGMNRLIHQDMPHSVRQRKGQLVRLGIAQADRQAALRVSVDQQDFFSGLRQPDSQVGTGRCLANAAFLVGNGNDFRVQINLLLLQKISLFRKIGMKKAAYSNK